MRMMIDLGRQRGPLYIIDTPTSVDCGREVRFRRSFRSLVECMVPCCGFQPSDHNDSLSTDTQSSTLTGTFFGYRKGRVSFCLQDDTRGSPLLLLEFAVPTAYLAREMQSGMLRIALECDRQKERSCSLYGVAVWSMYCNGRKVGFAIRRQMGANDAEVLRLMQSVSVGAGVLPIAPKSDSEDGDLMYLRASFDRVIGSVDSESFHMLNPGAGGSSGQELSIFLLRS
ncbi:hypothetical protein SLE2022_175350 [Rubroshorea leprosula]|uniref:Protein MIZU-KUSSEI 1 n=1 Tax=Rubroshorea leprosula TaxID=152421 RepID=A0AAV5L8H8_9ROSI|nr:hypothetical protein SLEP1_g41860 [Rubroshorea leprosula]